MNEVEHERDVCAQWPDGSQIYVDKHRYSPIAPWIGDGFQARCGTCGIELESQWTLDEAKIAYLSHALADAQLALMELSHYIGRSRNGT